MKVSNTDTSTDELKIDASTVTEWDSSIFFDHYDTFVYQLKDTLVKKNHDYTSATSNFFANFETVENMGIASTEKGILVRMMDKMSRLSTAMSGELEVSDESVEDTLQDLVGYSILLSGYLRSKKPR